ncbi:alpha/beta fold hydrolase [Lichenibacterium minor]|uniref:Alpha/beta fold hydrolase n=1 Tax=Lichenibacterium minor TaxID=2316528 RepID=A0A4Q2U1G1_9HYPH|nr:alpha/beta fold hydrolase [Lichenibacterium minor]
MDVLAQGAGPLVVLLPSRGRAAEDFNPIAGPIAAAGYRVLRPEPRGVGGSTGPTAGLNLHDLGGDVEAVIEAAHDGPAVVVGHAFGNFVARTVASDRPDLVRGVVIAAAAGRHYPDALAAAVTASSDTSRPDAERLPDLQRTFFAPGHDPAVWLGGWYPAVDAYQRAATLRTKQSDWWAAGRAPLLEIQAAEDPFKTPDQRGELRAEFGDRVAVALIPDAGHALVPEQPRAVAAAIVGWLETVKE